MKKLTEILFPEKIIPEEELNPLRDKVRRALGSGGLSVSTYEGNFSGLTKEHARMTVNEVGLPSEEVEELLIGLNEVVTNFVTGLVVLGDFKDSNHSYSNKFDSATSFIDFLTKEYMLLNGVPPNEYQATRPKVIYLLADLAFHPSASQPTQPELQKLFSHIFYRAKNYEIYQSILEREYQRALTMLEVIFQVFVIKNKLPGKLELSLGQVILGLVILAIDAVRFSQGRGAYNYDNRSVTWNLSPDLISRQVLSLRATLQGITLGFLPGTLFGLLRSDLISIRMWDFLTLVQILVSIETLLISIVTLKQISLVKSGRQGKAKELILAHELVHEASIRHEELPSGARVARFGLIRLSSESTPDPNGAS